MLTITRPIAVDGAATLARAIAKVFELRPSEPFDRQSFCRELIGFARAPEIVAKMQMVSTLLSKGVPAPEAADHLGRGVATQLSELMVPASLNCDLLFPSSRFPSEFPPGDAFCLREKPFLLLPGITEGDILSAEECEGIYAWASTGH